MHIISTVIFLSLTYFKFTGGLIRKYLSILNGSLKNILSVLIFAASPSLADGLMCNGSETVWSSGVPPNGQYTAASPYKVCMMMQGTRTILPLEGMSINFTVSGLPTSINCLYTRTGSPTPPPLKLTINVYHRDIGTTSWLSGNPSLETQSCSCKDACCNASGGGGYPSNFGSTRHPIATGTGEEFVDDADWVSPRDARFSFSRHYSSSETYYLSKSAIGNGMAWWSQWEKRVYQINVNKFNYYDDKNNWYNFTSSGTSAPLNALTADHPFKMEREAPGNASRIIVSDGRGRKEYYTRPGGTGAATALLNEVKWADGYDIQVSRDVSGKISALADNRGQRAQYTWALWTVDATTGLQVSVVSKIEVDTAYNGTSFNPDVSIDYAYSLPTSIRENVILDQALTTDLASSVTIKSLTYAYDTAMTASTLPSLPVKLLSISDGRTDSLGQPFTYEEIQYTPSLSGNGLMRATKAGLSGLTVDTYEVNEQSSGQIELVNPLGKKTNLTFATVAGRKAITQADGVATSSCLATTASLGYTPSSGAPAGYIYQQIGRNGSVTNFTRDARGLVLTKTEDALGITPRVTSYTWNTTLRLPLTRTTDGMLETFTYTPEGLLLTYAQKDTKVGSPTLNQVRIWTYTYTTLASGLKVLTTLDGPGLVANGITDVTTYTYTASGDLATVTDPNGLVTTVLASNDQGQPTQVEQPDKYVWTFSYDRMGRVLTSAFNPPGQTPAPASFGYDIVGQMTSYTDSLGQVWTFTYDKARRLVKTVSPSGDTASFTYDAAGNVTKTEYSNGTGPVTFWEQTQFDELSRLLKTIGAQGQQWTYTHDVEDNLNTETDPQTKVNTYGFDALNRLTSVIDRETYTTAMAYDAHDRQTSFTDPRTIATTFTYNGFGEVITEVSADRGTWGYAYDQRGLVSATTDPRGVVVNYAYDNGSRLTLIDYPSGGIPDQVLTYDTSYGSTPANAQKGKVARISDGVIQTTFGTEPVSPSGIRITYTAVYPASRTYAMSDETNLAGQKLRTVYPSGREVLYQYDLDGRISRIQLKNGATVTTLADSIIYKPNGPVASMVYGDGYTQTRSYDSSYRLTDLADSNGTTTLRQMSYGYDLRDDLTAVNDLQTTANSEVYGYTPRESLTSATGPYGTLAFTYDGVGNRVTAAVGAVTDSYSYPATSNRLSIITPGAGGSRGYTYDAMGNVTGETRPGGAYGYTYDSAGRMVTFLIGGVQQASYKYDFAGRQAIRALASPTSVTIHSVFDSEDRRIAEYDEATGALIREYVWLGWEPIAVIEGGVISYIRADHIGRPVLATNTAGVKVWTASYLPFGEVRTTTGNPIEARFPGQWFQSESGLHQNWMRDYDPTTGRYIEADPLGLTAGSSLYGYALQNPARFSDPRGENPLAACAIPALAPLCAKTAQMCLEGVVIGGMLAYEWLTEEECADCTAKKDPVQTCEAAFDQRNKGCRRLKNQDNRRMCFQRVQKLYAECLRDAGK